MTNEIITIEFRSLLQVASHLKSENSKGGANLIGENGKRNSLLAGRFPDSLEKIENNHLELYPSSRLRRWKPAPVVLEHVGSVGEMGIFIKFFLHV